MLTALKKLVGNDGQNRGTVPSGMQAMGQNLQKKFAKGVQYNMKIIIKGDRNTGKTTLFHRLQGQKFIEDYIATQEIQVASIQWNYKNTDDVVKVEVWDVVDKGKSRKKHDGLKIENEVETKSNSSEPCLDAEFLDVYKGTHGVIMMMDMTKQWTYDYIERELPKVPNHIPVLVLVNFRDIGEHRVIQRDEIKYFIEHFERPIGSAIIRCAESSMKNGFGLKYLHQFFNVPFLILQRETLMRQLETNRKDIDCILEELDIHVDSEEQNYYTYVENLELKQRNQAKQKAAAAAAAAAAAGKESSEDGNKSPTQASSNSVTPNSMTPSKVSPSPSPGTMTPTSQQQEKSPSTESTGVSLQQRVSRFFGGGSSTSSLPDSFKQHSNQDKSLEIPVPSMTQVKSVEEFVPEEAMDRSFLEDTGKQRHPSSTSQDQVQHNLDSDDDDGHNPMVAGFIEDLDSEDEAMAQRVAAAASTVASFNIELSTDDEEDGSPFASNSKSVKAADSKARSPVSVKQEQKTLDLPVAGISVEARNGAIDNRNAISKSEEKESRNRKSTVGSSNVSDSDEDEEQSHHVSTVMDDVSDEEPPKEQKSKKKTAEESVFSSPPVFLDSTDLDFLESQSGLKKTSTASTTPTTSSVASTKEGSSEEDRKSSSSAKKKKHKEKNRTKDKDEERSHKKHKHKKHKDKDREKDKEATKEGEGKEKKKKKKSKKTTEDGETESKKEMDELEAFLSGGDLTPNKPGADYEVF